MSSRTYVSPSRTCPRTYVSPHVHVPLRTYVPPVRSTSPPSYVRLPYVMMMAMAIAAMLVMVMVVVMVVLLLMAMVAIAASMVVMVMVVPSSVTVVASIYLLTRDSTKSSLGTYKCQP